MTGLSVWAFGAFLMTLTMLSTIIGRPFMVRTALALTANWSAHMLHAALFNEPSPVLFSIFADILTLIVIVSRPAGRMQGVIGATLWVQIGIGCGYFLSTLLGGYDVTNEVSYWRYLDWFALLQILLLGAWFVDGAVRYALGDRYLDRLRGRHAADLGIDRQGVVGPRPGTW